MLWHGCTVQQLPDSCECWVCAEGNLLQNQAEDIKRVSEYVSQLRRVGKGLGVFEFDRYLREALNEEEREAA